MTNNKDMFKLSRKVAVISVMAVAVMVSIFVCNYCSSRADYFICNSQYYTGNQIKVIFNNNEDQFTKVAKIVLGDEAIVEKIKNQGQGKTRIQLMTDKYYFNDEQWKEITKLFQKVKPLDITRYDAVIYGDKEGTNYIIGIHFPQNNKGQSVDLYYIDLPNEVEITSYQIQYYDTFKKIGEHWWLGENLDGNPLNDLSLINSYYKDGEWRRKAEVQGEPGSA